MNRPRSLARALALLACALAVAAPACDADDSVHPTDTAAPGAGESSASARIEPKPVDGGGKTATLAGGGEEERYTLAIEPAEVAAGDAGRVVIKVVPREPWHINLDFPTSLSIQAPEGVKVDKAEQAKADAVALTDTSCEYGVGFTAQAPGTKTFTGTFKFAVCQDEACSPVTEKLEFQVAVK
jgi:hypothetical protein